MLVDSHCHLNYLDDPQAAIVRARQAGIDRLLCIGVEEATIEEVLQLASEHAHVYASVGEHPGSVSEDRSWVRENLAGDRVVAVGETGLDYHYVTQEEERARQRRSFEEQLQIAQDFDLPVIVHTRSAVADTLALINNFPAVRGVLHCFTESLQMAETAMEMGYCISISGIVTFNAADNVREVARVIPDDRLLIETDSPWLAPVPKRGNTNEPSYLVHTCEYLAALRGVDADALATLTADNFDRLFGTGSS